MSKKKKIIKNIIIKSKQSSNKIKNDYNKNVNSSMFTRVNTRRNINDDIDTFIK